MLRAKGQAAQSVLTLVARVNEAQLTKQTLGRLPELLRAIQTYDRTGTVIDLPPE